MTWITDLSKINDDKQYIVCAINRNREGELYLGQPCRRPGWAVKQLMPKLYAALEMPEFKPEEYDLTAERTVNIK